MSVESGLGAPAEQGAEVGAAPSVREREPLVAPSPRRREARRRRNAAKAEVAAAVRVTPPTTTRRGAPRRQGRRVRRVVRRIELWSVLKVSLGFNAVMLAVALVSVALLWGLANTTGLIDDLEGFLRDSGFEDFRFQGDRMFRQVAFIGAVIALAFTVFTVLSAALINLISEVTGGIRFVVIEEIVPPTPTAAPAAAPTATAPAKPTPRSSAASPFPRSGPDAPGRATSTPSGPPPSWPGALPSAGPGRSGRRPGPSEDRPSSH